MSIVAELFKSIRKQKHEVEASTFEPYHKLLMSIIDEKEIDAHEADEILSQHDRTQEDVERDVEILRKRLVAAQQIKDAKAAEVTVKKAESDIQAIFAQRQKLIESTQPALEAATATRDSAMRKVEAEVWAKRVLTSNLLDPEIIHGIQELKLERDELFGTLKGHQKRLEYLEGQKRHAAELAKDREERTGHAPKGKPVSFSVEITEVKKQIESVQSEIEVIDERTAELDAKKLTP